MQRKVFIKGQTFGEWVYLGEESHQGKARTLKCRCSCGKIRWVIVDSILRGVSKSCGCKKIKHNLTKTKFNTAYINMVQRCDNPNHKSYKDYGVKGIRVEWKNFMEFYNDMYDSYLEHCKKFGEKETTIDRIDSKGNYCKENCRWATRLEQSNNLSSNRMVIYRGKKYATLASLCREYGIAVTTLNMRINEYGMTIEEAIETPVGKKNKSWKSVEYGGRHYESISQLCRELGIAMPTVINRVRERGISLNESINISLEHKEKRNGKERRTANTPPHPS